MSLIGKLEREIEIKSCGDLFHELCRTNPHQIPDIAPDHLQSFELHEGDFINVGSVITWNYTHDGKPQIAKDVIEAIDEENKSLTMRVIGGDLLDLYKSFITILHVNTKGENSLVKWTFEYEKLNENVEDPISLMDFAEAFCRDIESHHLM